MSCCIPEISRVEVQHRNIGLQSIISGKNRVMLDMNEMQFILFLDRLFDN